MTMNEHARQYWDRASATIDTVYELASDLVALANDFQGGLERYADLAEPDWTGHSVDSATSDAESAQSHLRDAIRFLESGLSLLSRTG